MSSPEVENFEITDDDVYNSFNLRQGRRQTKNQATYGMWADNDSDDERPGFGGGKKKSDFTAPIGFVSGGIKQGDKTFKPGEEEVDDDENDADFDIGDIARLSYKGKKKSKDQGYRRGVSGTAPTNKGDIGDWEKHTKGLGMKLMQKMGFEVGKGLGKNKQGITTPVEAVKRKGQKAGIAFHGSERSDRSLIDFPVQDQEAQEAKEFKEQLSQWRKEPEGKKKKIKYVYKTAQEAIEIGSSKKKGVKSQMSNVKVIDMTGKEKKVLTGYHTISNRHDRPDDDDDDIPVIQEKSTTTAFSMPELTHNLNLLVDMSEEDIVQNDRKLRHEKDLIVNMKYEKERLDTVLEQEEKQIERLAKVLEIIGTCNERTNPGCSNPVTLDECLAIFRILQNEFYTEYKMYELETLAIALVFPIMREHFKNWNPLADKEYGLSVIKEWQYILGDPNHVYVKDQNNMDVYQRLIWDIWLPHVRTAILKWSCRQCDPVIELLETWMPLLPTWVMENILDQLVLPRLMQEVENWNPLTDTMPIHAWLHPWLPLMGDKLEPLYAPIRHKLGNALTNWHPSDSSAKVILKPWQGVFREGHMEVFLRKNILPKLEMCLQEFPINPHQQTLEPLHWVLAWTELISLRYMVPLFEKCFFSRWLQVLCTWLGNMPNYDEVTKWYLGWKSVFTEQYLTHPVIKEMFTKALDMMNRAVSGHFQPGVKENMAYFTHTERRNIAEPNTSRSSSPSVGGPLEPSLKSTSSTYPASFRELVERKAEENNLVFIPIPGKTHEAKQVYRCGRVSMYFDRSVVFMMDESNQFIPVSLQKLIETAK
ncbi:tuftelin-interacting protein 11-like [Mercenaria mercenaria]|uniref:tuftelin-interacting protein 11-like n=1 Tax=Mercenaria mercenaria TaxID=6596 RepID=UPI00234ECC26|nr:tuftelin-interacting protein 11-like [Mercenaria mercenaria]XP_053397450.1 tuftelin-interacting protein 11-like [Mercenaria mercenaria]